MKIKQSVTANPNNTHLLPTRNRLNQSLYSEKIFVDTLTLCPALCLCLTRDADETKEWIEEKNQALNTDNYGHDLASVQALQRKHEGFERDLAALGDKVSHS